MSLTAKLTSLQNTDPWSQAGVMLRDTLKADANHVFVFATPGNGLVHRSRESAKKGTKQTMAGAAVAPVWVRVDRKSSTVTTYRSADGVKWTAVASVKLSVSQPYLVGLAVASHSKTSSVSATFSDVSLNGTAVMPTAPGPAPAPAVNVPPTVSMTSPGGPFTAPASMTLAAVAADSDGTVAKVDFYSGATLLGTDTSSPFTFSWANVAAGSYTLKAVATDNAGAATTSSPVTVTVNPNPPPTVSLTSPASGTSFMAPASTTLSATATDSNGVARVDFYAGSALIGSDTTSPYSATWSNVAAGSYVLTAVATDNAGVPATSAGVSVTVNANQAPTVSLTSPASGSSFVAPATIALTASASDVDGTVQKVEFYNGSTLLGSAISSPFAFTWSNVAAGSYSVSAVARDNMGATSVSSWSDITVGTSATLSKAIFTPAVVPDAIAYYVFEVFANGADPNTSAPVATQNLGLPAPVNGEITVDVKTTIANLAAGNYLATVSSVSSNEGTLRSPSFAFTR